MSTGYYGVTLDDLEKVSPLLEGELDPEVKIDVAPIERAILALPDVRKDGDTLVWEGGGGYIHVDLDEDIVEIHLGGGGGGEKTDTLMEILGSLKHAGLNIYDPQRGGWWSA